MESQGRRRPAALSPAQQALGTKPFLLDERWVVEPLAHTVRLAEDGHAIELPAGAVDVLVALAVRGAEGASRDGLASLLERWDGDPALALERALCDLQVVFGDRVVRRDDGRLQLAAEVGLPSSDSGEWRLDPVTGELVVPGAGRARSRLALGLLLLLLALVLGLAAFILL